MRNFGRFFCQYFEIFFSGNSFFQGTFSKLEEEELYTKDDIKEIFEDEKKSRLRKW